MVLPHLGGTGPSLKNSHLQREVIPAQVQKLVDLAGPDAEGLQRFHPVHEVVIGISGKKIDKATLSKSAKGPYKDAKFVNGAKNEESILLAGQHRLKALQKILEGTLKEYKKVSKKLQRDTSNLDLVVEQRNWLVH